MARNATASELAEACQREIVGLHGFFQQWFTGEIPDDEARFERVARALAPGFELVSPKGVRTEREPLLDEIRGACAGRRNEPFRIRIEGLRVRLEADELALVTYEEWQDGADGTTGRISSALLRRAAGAPEGVGWVHLHETWLPGHGPAT